MNEYAGGAPPAGASSGGMMFRWDEAVVVEVDGRICIRIGHNVYAFPEGTKREEAEEVLALGRRLARERAAQQS